MDSPLLFFSLFPIITAALRFSFLTSLAVALFIAIGYLALGFLSPTPFTVDALLAKIGNVVIILLAAVVTGLIGGQMKRRVALIRRQEEEEELRLLRARQQQSRLIFELASTLGATLNYQRVLEAILDVAEIGLQELVGQEVPLVGLILLFRGDRLKVAASRHTPAGISRWPWRGSRGPGPGTEDGGAWPSAWPPGKTRNWADLSLFTSAGKRSQCPLRAGFETFGLAVFGSPQTGLFTPDYQDLLSAPLQSGRRCSSERALYQSLMEEKERIVAVEEDARKNWPATCMMAPLNPSPPSPCG